MDFIYNEIKGRTILNQIVIDEDLLYSCTDNIITKARIHINNHLYLRGEIYVKEHICGFSDIVEVIDLEVSETELNEYLRDYYIPDNAIIRKTESFFGFFKKEKIYIRKRYYFKRQTKEISFTTSNFKIINHICLII